MPTSLSMLAIIKRILDRNVYIMSVFLFVRRFFLTIFLVLSGISFLTFAAPIFAAQTIGQVVWVTGTMKAIGADKKERLLKRKDFIYEQDTLTTAAESTGQIVFSDSSTMTFKENTTLKVEQYKFTQGKDPAQDKFVAKMAKGGFRTITGAISKGKPENYQLATPVATIGVRGTTYSVAHSSAEGTTAGISQGAIQFGNAAGSKEMTPSTTQYAAIKTATAPPVVLTSPPAALASIPAVAPVKPSPELTKAAVASTAAVQPAAPASEPAAAKSETKTEEVKPEEGKSEEAKPEEGKSEEAKPSEETKSEEAKPEEAKSDEAKSEATDQGESGDKEGKSEKENKKDSKKSGGSSSGSGGTKTVTSFSVCPA